MPNVFLSKNSRVLSWIMTLFLWPSWVLAADSSQLTDVLSHFLSYLTGDVGKSIAAVAIVGVGLSCFVFGKLSKAWVTSVVLGVGIVFGAHGILTTLIGG